ncbi:MAG: pyridoxal 5'-phosphate synthase glutaminase subunit PdxT [Acidobacteria bacterium]|nr:pyridoxal 5'-phosphate synthase glutaminase subunit PdxT [Acidobacteriota bacterium]
MKIGVLALQGAFAKHLKMLESFKVKACEVRTEKDLEALDGLIIPGGESTTMLRLMKDENLFEPLKEFIKYHPTFGTCAGAILLAKEVKNPPQVSLEAMNITIERNSYGRQINSFTKEVSVAVLGSNPLELVFIRAPGISKVGQEVEVIATCQNRPVLVKEGKYLAATFHPELTEDTRVHKLFLTMIGY